MADAEKTPPQPKAEATDAQGAPSEAPRGASTPKGATTSPAPTPRGALSKGSGGLQKSHSVKSQVSFSVDPPSKKSSMTTKEFMEYRQHSSIGGLLPSNFFLSQEDIRIWGVEDLTDPSIQPYDKDSESLPRPFHVSLPGYAPHLCQYVLRHGEKQPRDALLGPEITIFPPTWVPQWTPNPNFKPQRYGYNWQDSEAYKMDRLPYVNAEFNPTAPDATHMYRQAYPYAAYPYGVPRV
ncbi:uncharacterized protein LOC34621410 [Cyclospora cayetanensis]|uniref:Uncharacterized protein LOC34621410 n=1 Tax=Cyclospora cayetanensis TaxID=88456 RepID=A0A6P6RX72_9EIME|nr:uncharacterized protein LOC34621410 [Cyclospora cayetanensis]